MQTRHEAFGVDEERWEDAHAWLRRRVHCAWRQGAAVDVVDLSYDIMHVFDHKTALALVVDLGHYVEIQFRALHEATAANHAGWVSATRMRPEDITIIHNTN